jgi:hypothetical protein|uniref:Uncharacterized protein n=1 Tax=viral metagenome TaxID=1070528 RepID=A0A6C0M0Q1_9ZZZZ
MTEFDIKKYLKKLKTTLEEKDLESFYVMCDRSDFIPMKGYHRPIDIIKMFAEKAPYYTGKRVAHISLYVNSKGLKTNEFVFSIKITIDKILENGKFSQKFSNMRGVMINFKPNDLEKRRFHIKDVEKWMRLCADGTLYIDTFNGNWYTNVLKILKKKGIDFEND